MYGGRQFDAGDLPLFYDRHLYRVKLVVTGVLLSILSFPPWAEEKKGSLANYQGVEVLNLLPAVSEGEQEDLPAVQEVIDDISYNLTTSLYTRHWHPQPEHNNDTRLIGLERQNGDNMWGFALFKNSFDQDTQIVYWAKSFSLEEYVPIPGLRSKWLFGLIHGYKGEYKNKIPFNQLGVAPAIAPIMGIATRYLETDLVFLGFNTVTITATLPICF